MRLDRIKPSAIDGWGLELHAEMRTVKVSPTVRREVRVLSDSSIVRCFQPLRVCIEGSTRRAAREEPCPRGEDSDRSAHGFALHGPQQVALLLVTAESSWQWTLFA